MNGNDDAQKTIPVRVPKRMERRLDSLAKARLLKRSDIVREALLQYLAGLPEAELAEAKAN
jgi:predicted DNA-binding protein